MMNIFKFLKSFYFAYRTEIGIFLLSFLVKLISHTLVTGHNGPGFLLTGDSRGYLSLGESFARGEGFRMYEIISAFRTPLYPLFLSLFYFFKLPLALLPFIQNIMIAVASIFVYRIGKLIFTHRVGLIAALLFLFEPLLTVYTSIALSEPFFMFVFLAGIYYLARYFFESPSLRNLLFSAFFIGLSALTRPIAFYLPIIILLLLFVYARLKKFTFYNFLKAFSSFVLVFSALTVPWMLRNYIQFGTFAISNQGANAVYSERSPIVIAVQHNISYNEAFIVNQNNLRKAIPNFSHDVFLHTFTYNPYLRTEALKILRSDIPAVIRFHLIAAVSYFHTTGYDYALEHLGALSGGERTNFTNYLFNHQWREFFNTIIHPNLYTVIRITGYGFWAIANLSILIAVVYSLFRGRRSIFALLFMLVLVFYFGLFTIGPLTQARYRIPTYPFLFILIGYSYELFSSKFRRKSI